MEKSKDHLSLFSLSVIGVGIIIGAGIYAILGAAAKEAGPSLWISFLLAALVALFTGLSYAELATLFPKAGAEYIYLKQTYPHHDLPPFLLGFSLIIAGCATASTVAFGFGSYLQHFIPLPEALSAFFLILAATVINSMGIGHSSRTNIVLTAIEVLGLLIVIWFGWTSKTVLAAPAFSVSSGTVSAAALIFFVYLGFEDIVNLAEDTREPHKNIPRAILVSLGLTTFLYVAVAIAIMRIAPPSSLSQSDIPLAWALKDVAPEWMRAVSSIALFSTANTALITMLAVSRMILGMAKGGDLPEIFSKSGHHFNLKIPLPAILLTLAVSTLFLTFKGIEELASISSLSALWGFLAVNWMVIVLRYKKSHLKRPFKVPLNIGKFPVLPALGCLSTLFLLGQFKVRIHLIVLGIMFLGFIGKMAWEKCRLHRRAFK